MAQFDPFQTPFFTLESLAEGVYAAIAKPGTGAMGNAGIIDLGDLIVIFDTMYTPQAGQALHDAALHLFGRPASLVINSHFHMDHVGGNQVFTNTPILSTAKTRALTLEHVEQFLVFAKAHPEYPATVRQAIEEETDEKKREEKSYELGDLLAMDAALTTLVPTPATMTFENSLTLHGTKRSAVLRAMGTGHTPCDSVLYLPDEGILFTGDLLSVNTHPLVIYGNTEEWMELLDRLLHDFPIEKVVPGHGLVTSKDSLPVVQQYFSHLLEKARQLHDKASITGDSTLSLETPAAYADWGYSKIYELNVKHLLKQMQPQESS
ncbi:MBL fold metallo-hydrolase [Brevibacillus sp. 179-C9.3 HS]|uniref:MBL fold metallo-hydrolase n=1 Tax=unclassified Brevibacillus TaxID=2684853 RepID=UPI0039A2AC96